MVKLLKKSPTDKKMSKLDFPVVAHCDDHIWHSMCDQTVRKYAGQAVTSSFAISQEYRHNYALIRWE